MAIPQDRYIKINSSLVGDPAVAGRSFGGLVLTQGKGWAPQNGLKDDKGHDLTEVWDSDYLVVVHSVAQAAKYFASDSDEVEYAKRYFAFTTPAGGIPRILTYGRVRVTDGNGDLLIWEDGGWYTEGEESVASPTIETPDEVLVRISGGTINFGSLCFIDGTYTLAQLKTAAVTNAGYNHRFLFVVSALATGTALPADVASGSAAIGTVSGADLKTYFTAQAPDGISGLCLVQGDALVSAEMPMALFAATDYGAANTAPNPMFKRYPGETATVTDEDTADALDGGNINYNGLTQENGGTVAFYQRGRNSDGEDTAVYCNEVWLKSAVATAIMNLLLTTNRVAPDDAGKALIYSLVDSLARQGVVNGTIEKGKTLTAEQRLAVRQLTGIADAWRTIETAGYWIAVAIQISDGSDGVTQKGDYKAVYRLVYSKGDSIKFVEGTHNLV